MRRNLFFIFLFYSIWMFSQQSKIDSLTILFNETKVDTIKARLLAEIGIVAYSTNPKKGRELNDSLISFTKKMKNKYYAQGIRMRGTYSLLERDFVTAEKNYTKALELANNLNDIKLKSGVISNLGTLYGWQDKRELAMKYYKKSVDLNDSLGLLENNIRPYINIAITLSKDFQLEEANSYLFKALEIAENHNSNQLVYLYNEIANNYLRLEIYDKAEKFMKKALPIAEKLEDNFALGRINNSLGYLYETRDENWERTLFYYEKSLNYNKIAQNDPGIIDGYYNAGQQYLRLKNYAKARMYFQEGLDLASSKNSINKMIIGNLSLSELLISEKNENISIRYLNEGLKLIGNSSKTPYKNHFFRIGNLFADNKSYKIAYENVKDYAVLSDSLFKENSVNKIAEVETKYQTEKKEKENLQLRNEKIEQELKLTKENRQKWIFALALLATLITLGVFYFYYRKNKRQKRVIESLQKELHHRVKNNLSIIDSFIEVAKEEFNEGKFHKKLSELQNRIDSINEVHKQLYKNKDITSLNIEEYVEVLSSNVKGAFSNSNVSIEQVVESNLSLDADKSFSIGLIINEFLTNSYKYAFENKKGIIKISMKDLGGNYQLQLSDNGKGLPEDFDIKKSDSFGLRIMKLLSEQLDGSFALNNNNGLSLNIKFPK